MEKSGSRGDAGIAFWGWGEEEGWGGGFAGDDVGGGGGWCGEGTWPILSC